MDVFSYAQHCGRGLIWSSIETCVAVLRETLWCSPESPASCSLRQCVCCETRRQSTLCNDLPSDAPNVRRLQRERSLSRRWVLIESIAPTGSCHADRATALMISTFVSCSPLGVRSLTVRAGRTGHSAYLNEGGREGGRAGAREPSLERARESQTTTTTTTTTRRTCSLICSGLEATL